MKKTLFPLIALALSLAGCATFGIQLAGPGETREGADFKMLVDAWDKKAPDLGVVFSYRVNGGPWAQKPGIYNGSMYEAVVPGAELPAGYLEYYASMRNAKGETVSTKSATVKVLTFAEAKAKAEREYLSRLYDMTAAEFAYDEPAAFRLAVRGSDVPESVQCSVSSSSGDRTLPAAKGPDGAYEAAIQPPHSASFYSYQWTVAWKDAVFGRITSSFPYSPASARILDRAAVRARVEAEFRSALKAPGKIAGTYFSPPVVQARIEYGAFARRYSTGPRLVALSLRRGGYGKQIPMSEVQPGLFSATIPSADLEAGPVECSFLYSDSFADLGALQAQYPAGQGIAVAYKSLEDFRNEAAAEARAKLAHQPPLEAIEGLPLTLELKPSRGFYDLQSASLELAGPRPFAKGLPFIQGTDGWTAAIPGAALRAGALSYTISAVVRDQRFGDLRITLPESGAFIVQIKSMAQARRELEDALLKGLSHAAPDDAVQGKPLGLTLKQEPALPNESASLFYKTADNPRYRELRAAYFSGKNTFMLDAAATQSAYIQYYFAVSVSDPVLGVVTATLRDRTSGGGNDFIIAPKKDAAVGPGAPGTPGGPGGAEPPVNPTAFFQGPQADRAALRFFVNLDNEPGLYDIAVSVKFQGIDKDFRSYPLERKGKEYSYSMDARSLPSGSRVYFTYAIYRKGVQVQTLAQADGSPFSATLK